MAGWHGGGLNINPSVCWLELTGPATHPLNAKLPPESHTPRPLGAGAASAFILRRTLLRLLSGRRLPVISHPQKDEKF